MEQDQNVEWELHEHGNRAKLQCQNPAMNVVGKDGIRLERKLQDSNSFAESLHETEQSSKNDTCQH